MGFSGAERVVTGSEIPANFVIRGFFLPGLPFFNFLYFLFGELFRSWLN